MINYNHHFLNFNPIFTPTELKYLENMSKKLSLKILLESARNREEIGIEFIHSSSQLEGNAYDKYDTLTLLKTNQTAGGKLFSDAVMLFNLRNSYYYLLTCLEKPSLNIKDFIQNTHTLIAKDLLPNDKLGTVRQNSIYIAGTTYIPLNNPVTLNAELEFIINTAEKIENPFEKALYFHNNLAYLKFFSHFNQITARNVLTLCLMKANIFPCIFTNNHKAYADGMLSYYETGSFNLSKQYFIHAYEQTTQKYSIPPDPVLLRNNHAPKR